MGILEGSSPVFRSGPLFCSVAVPLAAVALTLVAVARPGVGAEPVLEAPVAAPPEAVRHPLRFQPGSHFSKPSIR